MQDTKVRLRLNLNVSQSWNIIIVQRSVYTSGCAWAMIYNFFYTTMHPTCVSMDASSRLYHDSPICMLINGFYDATTLAIKIERIRFLPYFGRILAQETCVVDFHEDAKSHVPYSIPHSHAWWTRQNRCYSLWHHRALWSLVASHTVLRVVEAKEELEVKSDHALQWLDETMISWGLRGEGLPFYERIWVPTPFEFCSVTESLTWTHLSKVRTWCH